MNENKQRIAWVDVAKFIGIFAIVLGHTLRDGLLKHYVYSFHVALFFVLSGVVFNATSDKTFISFLKKRFRAIIIPYFAFSIISLAIYMALGTFVEGILDAGVARKSFLCELFDVLVIGRSASNRPLWFLPCLFILSLLAFVVIRFAETRINKIFKYLTLWGTILFSVLFLLLDNLFFSIKNIPWSALSAISMLSFFLLGYVCKNAFKKLQKLNSIWLTLIAVVLLVLGGYIGMKNEIVSVMTNEYGNPALFYSSSLTTILGICLICTKIPAPKFIMYVGKHTLPILLMHKFPILFFQTLFSPTKVLLLKNDSLTAMLVAAISIGLCLVADFIISKFLPVIVGAKPKKTIT